MLDEDGTGISGAKVLDGRKVKIQDLSICMRFNLKLLGPEFDGRSTLINIKEWTNSTEEVI